jgi:hypothetical protein
LGRIFGLGFSGSWARGTSNRLILLIEIKYNLPLHCSGNAAILDEHLRHPTSRFQVAPSRGQAQIPDRPD